ncbi:MAG: hypothetical protein OEY59_02280 [Deltaproteobacteria bacterium]|nr:hypothetical protein [Deltaproteobacteria bacterium]
MKFKEVINVEARTEPLVDSMDHNLRCSLWDILMVMIFERYFHAKKENQETLPAWETFFDQIYQDFLKLPLDDRPPDYNDMKLDIQKWFYKNDHEFTYAFLQFMSEAYQPIGDKFTFQKHCNFVLEREFADRRFIDGEIMKIKVQRRS